MIDPKKCPHSNFNVDAKIARLAKSDDDDTIVSYSAEIQVVCMDCGTPFEFIGLEPGYSPNKPMVAYGEKVARMPIKPYDPTIKKEIIYVQHRAGSFEDGLQVCTLCGQVICDYSSGNWMSNDNSKITGYREGLIFITGTNPVTTSIERPKKSYGPEDPYIRIVIKCDQK